MSNTLLNLEALYSNPFVFSTVFYSFYKKLEPKENSLLLSYLVLPLTLYPSSQQYLNQKYHSKSSLRILVKESSRLYGIHSRVEKYREITNVTLEYLCNIQALKINENLSIAIQSELVNNYYLPIKAEKAAERLAVYFSELDISLIYLMLGIKQL